MSVEQLDCIVCLSVLSVLDERIADYRAGRESVSSNNAN
jgi:hypothetical protein